MLKYLNDDHANLSRWEFDANYSVIYIKIR